MKQIRQTVSHPVFVPLIVTTCKNCVQLHCYIWLTSYCMQVLILNFSLVWSCDFFLHVAMLGLSGHCKRGLMKSGRKNKEYLEQNFCQLHDASKGAKVSAFFESNTLCSVLCFQPILFSGQLIEIDVAPQIITSLWLQYLP